MDIYELANAYGDLLEKQFGPFDPLEFHVFPFDAGGSIDFLTIGKGRERFVTYITCGLFVHPELKRGKLGYYELMVICDSEDWVLDNINNIARLSLMEVLEPNDTIDIGPYVSKEAPIQGVLLEEVPLGPLEITVENEHYGLLRCIGITRPEMEYKLKYGAPALFEKLKNVGIYPKTIVNRDSIRLD
ncbi:MAG TPA: suppressor of fused domain protein [Verrucomicrobiota bacterium]|nr:suppressor of fused domain protein [Verrucomicrobiota bacterium]